MNKRCTNKYIELVPSKPTTTNMREKKKNRQVYECNHKHHVHNTDTIYKGKTNQGGKAIRSSKNSVSLV